MSFLILIAVATIMVLGGGLVGLLWRGDRRPNSAEWFGWAWVLGTAGISLLLAILGIVLPGGALLPTVSALCAGIGAWGYMHQRPRKAPNWLENAERWELFFLLGAIALVTLSGVVTTLRPLYWDGIILWEFKARAAFLSGGALPAAFFRDPTQVCPHPSYPLSFPLTELWIYLWVGDCDQRAVQWLTPVFLAAASTLLLTTVARLTGKIWPALVSVVALTLLPNFALGDSFLAAGYADFPLAVAYLATLSAILFEKNNHGTLPQWPIAAACGAACVWLKAEGLFLWGTSLIVALCHGGMGHWRRVLRMAIPGAALLLGWKFALIWMEVPASTTFQPITLANLLKNLPRISHTLKFMGEQLINLKMFSILWPLILIAIAELWVRRRPAALALTAAVVVPLTLDVVPYVFTSYDVGWHLTTSCSRLILQLVPAGLVIVGLAVGSPHLRQSRIGGECGTSMSKEPQGQDL